MITDHRREVSCDVIVIGAGPAGSTAAALLAEQGHDVVVLERGKFPRYHVGESLIPHCWFTLNRLGVTGKLDEAGFTHKHSVQFVTPDGKLSAPFYFSQHRDHPSSRTWQVWRCQFDNILAENAAAKGATIRQQTNARSLIYSGDGENGRVVGVEAEDAEGKLTLRAPMTIDASGRDMFTLSRNDWRVRDPKLNKVSLWSYWKGAKRDAGLDEGATTVAYLPQRGWFWYIPLRGDIVSVGIVAERDYLYRDGLKDPEQVFAREVEQNAWIQDHLSVGCQDGRYRVTGDYSYRGRHCAADGLLLVGDAFAFLDPVFSSGVFLALKSGELAADAVHVALRAGDTSAGRFGDYADTLRGGIEAMRKLVYAFYDEHFSFKDVIMKHPHLRSDLTDCLIGDLFRDFDELFAAVGEFAALPAPLPHGRPAERIAHP